MRLLGKKRKILQIGPVSRAVQGRAATAVPSWTRPQQHGIKYCTLYCGTYSATLAGVRGMLYLQQRGRMQELGGSCERRVAEWPSDDWLN